MNVKIPEKIVELDQTEVLKKVQLLSCKLLLMLKLPWLQLRQQLLQLCTK
jgi:hypothetical protein